jgi:hypothetical protein
MIREFAAQILGSWTCDSADKLDEETNNGRESP